jgi:serine/threonine protein kinase/tetratricopeptide (TPR) repeat protein
MTLVPGTRLGRYEIRAQLGAGGMGEVYLARDTSELDRSVALKILPSEVAANPKRMQRFIQEARTVSSLNHPNILTIHEFGQEGDTRFIATEYVEGMTLREHLRAHRLKLHEVLDIATQVAAALDAAHEAHVVHRDIKPDNIMVRRRDHIVKVLDFGLAKPVQTMLAADDAIDTEAGTRLIVKTEPGVVMGTIAYMSPEQTEASEHIDHRTDIWSLGAVLYEMVTGHVPFEGKDAHRQIIAIQEQAPAPLSRFAEGVSDRLEDIVTKALAKDPDERYQTAKDFLIDLRNLKRKLEVDAEIDRTVPPALRAAATRSGQSAPSTASGATAQATGPQSASSAEYIVNQVKLHKRAAIGALAVLLLVGAAATFWYVKRTRSAALTDKDTILLTDFVNTTGDAVFDGTLKQGLAVQLGQSPFLDLFSDARVRQTLRLMGRSPDERVTPEIGREICQRQGLKALISGSITSLGNHYVLTLEAINSQSGDVVAREQGEAESKEQVLKTLSQATTRLREKLGESLSSIQQFDAPLQVTTSSLEALKAYSLGNEQSSRGKFLDAIPFYKRATELDPNFASAYSGLAVLYNNLGQPKLSAEYAEKAFALRERVSELEKLRMSYFYYAYATGEVDKAIEVLELMRKTYPRYALASGNLSSRYALIGQFEKSTEASREAIRIDPTRVAAQGNLAEAFVRLNRFAEAKQVIEQAQQQFKFDSTELHRDLYWFAFINGDAAAMQQQLTWASGKPDEYVALDWETQAAAFAGQWTRSQDLSRRAIELAAANDAKENGAQYAAEAAMRAAVLGQCAQTKAASTQALSLARNQVSLTRSALAALCGESSQAQSLVDELKTQYPKDTLVNSLWLPTIRAALELPHGNAQHAIELLEPALRYEPAAEFWPQYVRGLSYLKLNKGAEAATEFRKILDHRGEGPLSVLYPLADLGLARAAALQGDATTARKAYQDFFALWKDADSDIPILAEAKKEYEKLK